MTRDQLDPARLQGEALRRWYLRTPLEIETERSCSGAGLPFVFFAARHQKTFGL